MAYNENPNPENLMQKEIEIIEEEIRQRRKTWIRSHMTMFYIIAGVILAAAIFFGIKWYQDSHNPISRFISASGKNLGTSFSFHITAEKNGETMMTYDGAIRINPSAQSVELAYDADYGDYSYRNAVYTNGAISYKGNYYNGQWTLSNCTERVQEYFDFYNDYKNGVFDGGSFLRFTGLNNYLYAAELNRFMDTVKGRLSSDSSIARITSSTDGGDTTYHYDVNLSELFELIRSQGAPVFYTSPDYNRFVAQIEANTENLEAASSWFEFTVNGSGYMSMLRLSIDTGKDTYNIDIRMDDFGSTEPDIPDDFYEAAAIQKPR